MFKKLFGGSSSVDPKVERMNQIFDQFNFTKFNKKAFAPYLSNLLTKIGEDEKIQRLMFGFDSLTAATEKQVVTADKKVIESFTYDKITGVESGIMKFQLHTKGGTINIKTHDKDTGKSEMVAYIRGKIM